ncbi:coiled-coil domain-containing protein 103 isoform X2 [Colossoma macropomum]|uniref:coiled-coil domain-containing protein 103 isoform X2 n=1 Tax=Colossoma macropomum TaxID=42526 RepID=UPI0018648DD8|nr:coiled-coil domain-containing protein 103 isoform X2 [Colossoma macropomum]
MDRREIIDFSALERELQAAVEADKKYQRENDAKFRAIHQKVATYEEFRDIVLASHLKPLDKRDKAEAPRKQPWNSVAAGRTEKTGPTPEMVQSPLSDFQPRTASEFMRDWRRFGGGPLEKYGLLLRLGGDVLQGLFSAEVGFGLLGEFLVLLAQCLQPGDEAAVTGLLEGLSKTGRFGLNVSLLSQAEQEACKSLFCRLWDTVGGPCLPNQTPSVNSEDQNQPSFLSEASETQQRETEAAGRLRYLMERFGICETES